ncbi:GlxA family transcriptional regulator [Hongsoonwoonella zoysiae]|uniref:GlxA family transcriptional regulator n=1 Tax=Hongsoonwoonella zoysiae TaxID=2821844 RepID=UPI001AEED194|nr:helix-turn-helix domain-containing protein [Hongsoonwoonella zoysiae]
MACLTSAIEPLRAANEISGQEVFRWKIIAESGQSVTCSAGVTFTPDRTLEEADDGDYLFLLSSPTGEFENRKAADARLRYLLSHGTVVGGFSGGIFPLARAGVMNGHRCSVHWCYDGAFRHEFPDVLAESSVISIDGRRMTASGSSAVFDLMLMLIEKRLGMEIANEVGCWFQHHFSRDEDFAQRIPATRTTATHEILPEPVRSAVRLFRENMEEPLGICEVARRLGVSIRHLERMFVKHTGLGPHRYYRLERLKLARQMIRYTDTPLPRISNAIGYARTASLKRHYRREFGISPGAERRHRTGLTPEDAGALPMA